jgi:hypothetical protein
MSSSSSSSRRIVRVRGRPYVDLADPSVVVVVPGVGGASEPSSSKAKTREDARRRANANANDSRGWRDDAGFRRASDADGEDAGGEGG